MVDNESVAEYLLYDLFRCMPQSEVEKHKKPVANLLSKYGNRVIIEALLAVKDKRHSGEPARNEIAYFYGAIRKIGENEKGTC